ncbi:Mitochondrial fission process protein 1 [Fukomys damarensis]|uniref:Mitochondrial fission process protein 1 n=1 Tax=Fukomys damarensis TaxID=885580 RepID=A0A091CZG4_FUKDA|nr:Mitochondrial fission process protein 1 [Fukomys damarensis]
MGSRSSSVSLFPPQQTGRNRTAFLSGGGRYANEVGEAFRSLVPRAVVWLSYGVSSSYVLADAIDKGKKAGEVPGPEASRSSRVTVAVVDTFVWQALASVAIPGFTINRVCAASLHVLGTATRWPLAVRKWTTTALGLLAIPVIIHPIDRSVDFLLDSSLRKLYPSVGKSSSS